MDETKALPQQQAPSIVIAARPRTQGSMTSAQASVGAAATWPTSGTIFKPADATRHGAAATPQPPMHARHTHSSMTSADRFMFSLPLAPIEPSPRRYRLNPGRRGLRAFARLIGVSARRERDAHAALLEA